MRISRASLLALPLVALGIAGCGGSGDPFTRIESTYDGMVDSICRSCPAAAAATTEAECRQNAASADPFEGAQWECQRSAYRTYPSELGPYYDCVARGVSTFSTCMRNAAATCPPSSTAISTCSDQLDATINACPMPDSIAASQAVAACFNMP